MRKSMQINVPKSVEKRDLANHVICADLRLICGPQIVRYLAASGVIWAVWRLESRRVSRVITTCGASACGRVWPGDVAAWTTAGWDVAAWTRAGWVAVPRIFM